MSKKLLDPIIEAFILKYGILNLLNDIGVTNIQKTSKDQIIATCPYHDDKKPSFSVNLESGLWTCFACDAHGDTIEMIKLSYHLNFQEAKNFLLARSGLDENVNIEDITFKRDIFNNTVEYLEEEPVKWPIISKEMVKRMYSGPDPYNYLLGRGFSQSTIEYFECGYAKDYLGRGYANQQRVTIPGHNEYGQLCGFIGRTPIDVTPKYLYTSGYPKSHTLFNLHRAKKYSDKGLILVEGPGDVMKVHNLEYFNVIAILGSSLSEAQQKLLMKYTDKVYFMFDNDSAGIKANFKAIETMQNKLDTYFIKLDFYKDPGEIPNKAILDKLINKAKNWNDFKFKREINAIK